MWEFSPTKKPNALPNLCGRHIGTRIDTSFGKRPEREVSLKMWRLWSTKNLRYSHFESLLDRLHHVLICLAAYEGDTEAFSTESTGTTNSVQVRICITRKIVIDCKIDPLDIYATTKDICSNADSLIEFFEFFVSFDTELVSGW